MATYLGYSIIRATLLLITYQYNSLDILSLVYSRGAAYFFRLTTIASSLGIHTNTVVQYETNA